MQKYVNRVDLTRSGKSTIYQSIVRRQLALLCVRNRANFYCYRMPSSSSHWHVFLHFLCPINIAIFGLYQYHAEM